MALQDKPGALAKVATVLGEAGVSIDRMRQYQHTPTTAPVLIVTHKTTARRARQGAGGAAGHRRGRGHAGGDPHRGSLSGRRKSRDFRPGFLEKTGPLPGRVFRDG
jgi:hypothetical protein